MADTVSDNYRENIIKRPTAQHRRVLSIINLTNNSLQTKDYQVHHLISKKSVKLANMGKWLVDRGYNINRVENLESYPSNFQLACHMKLQLHRGNHGTQKDEESEDESHPSSYHEDVHDNYLETIKNNKKYCDEATTDQEKLAKDMDNISKKIKGKIKKGNLQLSIMFAYMDARSEIGCANKTNIKEARPLEEKGLLEACQSKRVHF